MFCYAFRCLADRLQALSSSSNFMQSDELSFSCPEDKKRSKFEKVVEKASLQKEPIIFRLCKRADYTETLKV